MLLLEFTELKDAKQASSINKIDLSLDHHQHNGTIKSTLSLYSDKSGKNSEMDILHSVKLPAVADGEKTNNTCIDIDSKTNDMEVAKSDENLQQANVDDSNKAADEYEHSLWKWPSGRSCFTKVLLVIIYTRKN